MKLDKLELDNLKYLAPVPVFLLLAALLLFFFFSPGQDGTVEVYLESGSENFTVYAEKAVTPEERSEGLMYREELAEDGGMLFVYGEEGERSFWMKNTRIPLDIVFISEEGRINSIERADPEPGVSETELERYRGEGKYVLELNQNFTLERNISVGDRVFINP